MLERFPFDVGSMWEVDLEAFMASTWATFAFREQTEAFPASSEQRGYCANLLRGVNIQNKDIADDIVSKLDELFKVGSESGVKAFVEYGLKCDEIRVFPRINDYLTSYTNELFKYVCNTTTHIDNFFEDYNDLVTLSQSNTNARFVINLVNKFVEQFIEINKDEKTRLDHDIYKTGSLEDQNSNLCVVYRVRVVFTKACISLLRLLLNSDGLKPELDKNSIVLNIPKGSSVYNSFAAQVNGCFENRMLRLYLENPNSTQGLTRVTVFKCMDDSFKLRLL